MTSKRNIQARLTALEAITDPDDPPAAWMVAWDVPKALWDDSTAAWRYAMTDGNSHPDLDTGGED